MKRSSLLLSSALGFCLSPWAIVFSMIPQLHTAPPLVLFLQPGRYQGEPNAHRRASLRLEKSASPILSHSVWKCLKTSRGTVCQTELVLIQLILWNWW
jgi:hypothetical protein